MKYIYGPLPSRRLGFSLGINLTPYKTCSFDCIYCQLGKTNLPAKERKEYYNHSEIVEELRLWLFNNPDAAANLDYITLSGSGEPGLDLNLSDLIVKIKSIINKPVAVITNSSLIALPELRQELLSADLLIPSLDAATQEIFERIDRPVEGIQIEKIIEGLVLFSKMFKGKLWIEIMLVKGVNDSFPHIEKLKEALESINFDKIQLNSPVRTTAHADVWPVDKKKLEDIREALGDRCEII